MMEEDTIQGTMTVYVKELSSLIGKAVKIGTQEDDDEEEDMIQRMKTGIQSFERLQSCRSILSPIVQYGKR
jgi:hypothetical protein